MIYKPGFKTQFSQVYSSDDPNLETDVQFGVTRALVGQYVLHEGEAAPAADVERPVVFARSSLRHRAGRSEAAEAADHRQGERRASGPGRSAKDRMMTHGCRRFPHALHRRDESARTHRRIAAT